MTAATSLTTAVTDGVTHDIAVSAVDAAGNEGPSVEIALVVPDVTPPTGPALQASPIGATGAALAWSEAADNVAVTSYVVLRDNVVVATLGGSVSTFSETGLASDQTYAYSVYALDAAGNSSPVSTASVTLVSADRIAPTAPGTPLASALSKLRVLLTWTALCRVPWNQARGAGNNIDVHRQTRPSRNVPVPRPRARQRRQQERIHGLHLDQSRALSSRV